MFCYRVLNFDNQSYVISQTSGLVDLFGHAQLVNEIKSWARQNHRLQDAVSATFYLVLAIGYQSSEEDLASSYFEHARNIALANLSGNINVPTIQTFILVTVYMLGSCQMNGAFLFFGMSPGELSVIRVLGVVHTNHRANLQASQ